MRVKFKSLLNKKAYLQIDFSFAIFLLFLFFLGIYSFYAEQLNSYDLEIQTLIKNADSNDICKLLISNFGNPSNWENDILTLNHIGLLKTDKNYLDPNKINVLNSTNYVEIVNSLGINSILNIKIINVSDDFVYLNFGAESTIYSKEKSISTCYSIYNQTNPVKILVEVWQ